MTQTASATDHTAARIREGRVVWMGTGVPYEDALAIQRRLAAARVDGAIPDTLLLLEHSPVYTAGRRSLQEHVLSELGAPLIETDRGGQTTFHGPGQLVGYPLVHLGDAALGPKSYVNALEHALIDALAALSIKAWCEDGVTAVWTRQGKIAAIGVRVTRSVTMHGFALNVTTDLRAFDAIVPCGIIDRSVTSLEAEAGRAPAMAAVREAVTDALGVGLRVRWQPTSLDDLLRSA